MRNEIAEDGNCRGYSRIGVCMSCDEWDSFAIRQGGWWSPYCRFWNPKKGTSISPYGMSHGCPLMLEHVILVATDGWRLSELSDYDPVVECLSSDRISKVIIEFRSQRRFAIYRDPGTVLDDAARRQALAKLSAFINMEMESRV